jgi:UDP-N-acetylmuramoyl-tripeptide--D-alanyl-D-alanine ligase
MEYIVSQFSAMEIADCSRGRLAEGPASLTFPGVSINTRTLRSGDLFFAIRGARLDGHRFISDALDGGAAGIVAESNYLHPGVFPDDKVLIRVPDTHQALKDLAAAVRRRWQGTAIGLTGSMGKTTTKEFTAQVLCQACSVYRSPGNYNNLYGLPLAIFGLRPGDSVAIFEMGMSEPGEIAAMCRIALPSIGIITSVAPVHLEFFDSVQAIADAKAELAEALPADGILVYNRDAALVRSIAARFRGRKISYGFEDGADVRADQIEIIGAEETRFRLRYEGCDAVATIPLAGAHFVMNALPAIALGRHYGLDHERIVETLRNLQAASMRGGILHFSEGFTVINDSYNSNPEALEAMIDVLSRMPGFKRRILVAGEMLELGTASKSLHRACGVFAARAQLDGIIGVRGNAQEIVFGALESGMSAARARFFQDVSEASDLLRNEIRKGDLLLVKGSRGVHMETIIEKLRSIFDCRN